MKEKCYSSVRHAMEALVIDWAKEEAKMAKVIWHIYAYC